MLQINIEKIREGRALALQWLVNNLACCDPFLGSSPAEFLLRRKSFNELAFFLMIQERFPSLEMAGVEKIRAFFAEKINDDYLSLAARRPETLLMYSSALAYATASGILSPRQEHFARTIVSGPFAWSIDGSAYRYLELLNVCRHMGVDGPLSADDVLKTSALMAPPSPIYGRRNTFYSLTHTEFYRFLLDLSPVERSSRLAVSLKGGMARSLAELDYDLGMELVMASCLQRWEPEPESTMLIEAVLDALTGTGLIKQSILSGVVSNFSNAVPTQQEWAESFHVMLVAAMTLSVVERFYDDAAFEVSTAEREFVIAVGGGLQAFHKYHFVSGIRHIRALQAAHPSQINLMKEIWDFLIFSRRHDGQFGHFVDELRHLSTMGKDESDEASLTQPVDSACREYLESEASIRFQ
jgi:hypothetical protein